VLYAPWLPTLLSQARHTGAPWSTAPNFHALVTAPGAVLAGDAPLMAFVLAGGTGLVAVVRRRDSERTTVLALALWIGVTILLAWIFSQLTPAWASRYLAVVLGPILLLPAVGLARAGRLGLVALVAVIFLWMGDDQKDDKSNARAIAAGVAPSAHPGDLVLSTHPEEVPVLRYYLGPGLRWATELGRVRDPQVMDWRDALARLRATSTRRDLAPLLASVRPGQRLIVFSPVFRDYRAWKAKWTKEVFLRSTVWTDVIARNPHFREVRTVKSDEIVLKRNFFKPLQAVVYVRTS
jgi:mannosyltransferase